MSHPDPKHDAENVTAADYTQPDIDICSECGEHAEFDENGSNCCGAGAYDTDPDTDMER